MEPLGPRIVNSRPLRSALTMHDANCDDLAQQDFGAGSCLAHPHRMPYLMLKGGVWRGGRGPPKTPSTGHGYGTRPSKRYIVN